jgi:hypothetical protein
VFECTAASLLRLEQSPSTKAGRLAEHTTCCTISKLVSSYRVEIVCKQQGTASTLTNNSLNQCQSRILAAAVRPTLPF